MKFWELQRNRCQFLNNNVFLIMDINFLRMRAKQFYQGICKEHSLFLFSNREVLLTSKKNQTFVCLSK